MEEVCRQPDRGFMSRAHELEQEWVQAVVWR